MNFCAIVAAKSLVCFWSLSKICGTHAAYFFCWRVPRILTILRILLLLQLLLLAAASDCETDFTFRYRRSAEQGQMGGKVKQKLLQ
jgi:hypothetical protein